MIKSIRLFIMLIIVSCSDDGNQFYIDEEMDDESEKERTTTL